MKTRSGKITLRSVKYDPDCYCPRKGEIPLWAIAIAILVVLIVAVAIFFVYRCFPLPCLA